MSLNFPLTSLNFFKFPKFRISNFCRWTVNLSDSLNYLLRKLDRQMFFWVEEHGGADAVFAVGAMEHIYVDATLAATPE